ncbi:MAG: hypothetical protein ABR502_11965 [Chitinophagaceae bacterium]
MRKFTLTCLYVAFVSVASAQFTILPKVGLENSKTEIQYNNLSSFSPVGTEVSPLLGMRIDYKFKKSHGPFLGVSTSRNAVGFKFSDPENGNKAFSASKNDMDLRFEGGYELRTKPIYFKKSGATAKSSSRSTDIEKEKTITKKSCGDYSERNHCGKSSNKVIAAKQKDKGWFMRVQPSAGIAYKPSAETDVITKTEGGQTTYEYTAGDWNTAFIIGAGFEFGKNVHRKFIVSLNYLKGIGNLDTKTLNAVSNSKPTTTYLKSNSSSWNLSLGVPINLSKSKTVHKTEQKSYKSEKKCEQIYKVRCRTVI